MVVHAYDPSGLGAEEGGSLKVGDQPQLHSEVVLMNKQEGRLKYRSTPHLPSLQALFVAILVQSECMGRVWAYRHTGIQTCPMSRVQLVQMHQIVAHLHSYVPLLGSHASKITVDTGKGRLGGPYRLLCFL